MWDRFNWACEAWERSLGAQASCLPFRILRPWAASLLAFFALHECHGQAGCLRSQAMLRLNQLC